MYSGIALASPWLGSALSSKEGVKGGRYRRNIMTINRFPSSLPLLLAMMSFVCWTSATQLEEAAMLTIKAALAYNPDLERGWIPGTDMCVYWQDKCGFECPILIVCDDDNLHITELYISPPVSGTLSPAIGQLTKLQKLSIVQTSMSGPIPNEIQYLPLINLSLEGNKFSGSLLPWLPQLKTLTDLSLNDNLFSGTIPSEISNIKGLKNLMMGGNMLRGQLPPTLATLQQLQYLDLSTNRLSGPIPAWLSDLQKLNTLMLQENFFSGPVPSELANIDSLAQLLLNSQKGRVKLTGSIPGEFGNMPYLSFLDLSENQLTGTIPRSLAKILTMGKDGAAVELNLANNMLSGRIPSTFRDFQKIGSTAILNVDGNLLTGLPIGGSRKFPLYTDGNNCFTMVSLKCIAFYASIIEGSSMSVDGSETVVSPSSATSLSQVLLAALDKLSPAEGPDADRRLTMENAAMEDAPEDVSLPTSTTSRISSSLGLVIGGVAVALLAVSTLIVVGHTTWSHKYGEHLRTSPSSPICQLPLLSEISVTNSERTLMADREQEGRPDPSL